MRSAARQMAMIHLSLSGPTISIPRRSAANRSRGSVDRQAYRFTTTNSPNPKRLANPAAFRIVGSSRMSSALLGLSMQSANTRVFPLIRGVVARIVTGPHEANRQDPHRPMRYDTGRPRAVIRLRISQPMTASLPCPAGLRARRPSPMMDLYRRNVFSTRP